VVDCDILRSVWDWSGSHKNQEVSPENMTPTGDSTSRTKTWQEEVDMLLSLLNCVVPGHEAVFGSSEYFTGKRYYDLCLENEARTPKELEKKLGLEYKNEILSKNKQQGLHFARKLRELGHKIVLTPAGFQVNAIEVGRNWSGSEYMAFWNLAIEKKCHTVYLNEYWQFSDSCVCYYIAALKAGKKLVDHAGNFLLLDSARKMVLSAIKQLEDFGFDVPNLHKAFLELKSFSSLG
jgi:hypothetical protein